MSHHTKQFQQYREIETTDFTSLVLLPEKKLAIYTATEPYIPIEVFKTTLEKVGSMTAENELSTFIFDKRQLRTFHQPSMEWYFAVWKPSVARQGIVNHIKILPDLLWFRKAVEAGKAEIYQKYGTDFLKGITIQYETDLEEAIKKIG